MANKFFSQWPAQRSLLCVILKYGNSNDFKVEADPVLLELSLAYAVRIAEERHPINDNNGDFSKKYLIVYFNFSMYDFKT